MRHETPRTYPIFIHLPLHGYLSVAAGGWGYWRHASSVSYPSQPKIRSKQWHSGVRLCVLVCAHVCWFAHKTKFTLQSTRTSSVHHSISSQQQHEAHYHRRPPWHLHSCPCCHPCSYRSCRWRASRAAASPPWIRSRLLWRSLDAWAWPWDMHFELVSLSPIDSLILLPKIILCLCVGVQKLSLPILFFFIQHSKCQMGGKCAAVSFSSCVHDISAPLSIVLTVISYLTSSLLCFHLLLQAVFSRNASRIASVRAGKLN